MKKVVLYSSVLLSMVLALTGCTEQEKSVVTYKDGSITETQLYETMKKDYGEQALQNLVINSILEKEFGDKVSEDDVDRELNKIADSYGGIEELEEVLVSYGQGTLSSYKESIKQNLLIREMMSQNYEITDESLQEALDTNVNFKIIEVESEASAKTVLERLENGEDWDDVSDEISLSPFAQEGGDLGWLDLNDPMSGFTKDFIQKVSELKNDEVSEVIKDDTGVFVVKMVTNAQTSDVDLEDVRESLMEFVAEQTLNSPELITQELTKLLEKHEVKYPTDEDLQYALEQFGIKPKETTTSSEKVEKTEESDVVDSSEADEVEETTSTEEEDVAEATEYSE